MVTFFKWEPKYVLCFLVCNHIFSGIFCQFRSWRRKVSSEKNKEKYRNTLREAAKKSYFLNGIVFTAIAYNTWIKTLLLHSTKSFGWSNAFLKSKSFIQLQSNNILSFKLNWSLCIYLSLTDLLVRIMLLYQTWRLSPVCFKWG